MGGGEARGVLTRVRWHFRYLAGSAHLSGVARSERNCGCGYGWAGPHRQRSRPSILGVGFRFDYAARDFRGHVYSSGAAFLVSSEHRDRVVDDDRHLRRADVLWRRFLPPPPPPRLLLFPPPRPPDITSTTT